MSNSTIVYKFDELDKCSHKMGQVIEALDNLKKFSQNTRNEVIEYWEGEAYISFIKRLGQYNNAIDKLYSDITNSKEKLDKAIALERQNEENLTTQTVGRLSTDNIF